jgi:gamma-glutamyltranspeptidase / glutathione hydrolase
VNLKNLTDYPYPSGRRVILGQRGAVATSQPLATLAGMEMLWAGGNAIDAALAMAIALTVVEPTSNGIGSDAFALVWDGQLHGLNASGKSPAGLTLNHADGLSQIPAGGWLPVTVPGAVSAWHRLWERWGKLPFDRLFEPAIRYAEDGFPVSPETARAWKRAEQTFLHLDAPEFQPFKATFFPHSRAPNAGETWCSPAHGQTLRNIAHSHGESFYQGQIAQQIAEFAAQTGGLLTVEDLANHTAEWVNPISTIYRDVTVWELPPNTQGMAALIALNLVEGFDLAHDHRESVNSYHWQIEAMKLAFADAHRYIADPNYLEIPVAHFLDKAYARDRRLVMREYAAPFAEPGLPKGGTVYLAAADEELMVSFIQSNFMGFGSGILIPGTGIALQNRGAGFSLVPEHPNCVGPAKRTFHTIIPGFLTQGDQPLGPFGVMGGAMQPQGHLQVVVNLVDYAMNPQAALDTPRWQVMGGNTVLLEHTVAGAISKGLSDRGHIIQMSAEGSLFGKGQLILKHENILVAASEPRADGLALAY